MPLITRLTDSTNIYIYIYIHILCSVPFRWLPIRGRPPASPPVPLLHIGRRGESCGHRWKEALQALSPPRERPSADTSQSGPLVTGGWSSVLVLCGGLPGGWSSVMVLCGGPLDTPADGPVSRPHVPSVFVLLWICNAVVGPVWPHL